MQAKIEETNTSVELVSYGVAESLPLIVAAARTCYSKDLPLPSDVNDKKRAERLARSVFKSGHHTLFQHPFFTFAIDGVSRLAVWSFLHRQAHYNTSQQSQRYVPMDEAGFVIPPLADAARSIYLEVLDRGLESYQHLVDLLTSNVEPLYEQRFGKVEPGAIKKIAMEAARYVLPLATRASMYYTVNFLTLLRLYYMCKTPDTPWEQALLADAMRKLVLSQAPDLEMFFQRLIPRADLPSWIDSVDFSSDAICSWGFNRRVERPSSLLIDGYQKAERLLANTVRDKLTVRVSYFSDGEAIQLVLNPDKNRLLAATVNPDAWSPLMESMRHVNYSFRTRMSHTALSQDQRHRMVPAALPLFVRTFPNLPDYITPELIRTTPEVAEVYHAALRRRWEAVTELLEMGVDRQFVSYILPNAVAVTGRHTGSLLAQIHKWRLRTCYNAQREIWKISMDEVKQIREKNPLIGQWIGPPCQIRYQAGVKPVCPEGSRFCGVRVWEIPFEERERLI